MICFDMSIDALGSEGLQGFEEVDGLFQGVFNLWGYKQLNIAQNFVEQITN